MNLGRHNHLQHLRASTPLSRSVYKLRDGKIVESQMFYSDMAAIARFLTGKS